MQSPKRQRTWHEISFTPSSCSCWRTSSHAAGEVGRSMRPPSAMSRPLAPRRARTKLLSSEVPPPGSEKFARGASGPRPRLRAPFKYAEPAQLPGWPCCASWAPGLWLQVCKHSLREAKCCLSRASPELQARYRTPAVFARCICI